MTYLSKQIRDLLSAADLNRREVSSVPLSALYPMAALGLIVPPWRDGAAAATRVNRKSNRGAGHKAPTNHGTVRLTPAGAKMASRVQRAAQRAAKPKQ